MGLAETLEGYRTEIQWGAILGAAVSLWIMIEFWLGLHSTRIQYAIYADYLGSVIPVVCIWMALRDKKKRLGNMRFLSGLSCGMAVALVGGIIFTGFIYFYNLSINPQWAEMSLRYTEEKLKGSGMNASQVENSLEGIRPYYTLEGQMFAAFLGSLMQGLILSAGLAFILRDR